MTIRVELSPETEARLVAEARAKGLPLEKVVEQLLNEVLTERSIGDGHIDIQDFHRMLDGMAKGSEKLPDLPTDRFSRANLYEDGLDGRDVVPRR